MYSFADAGAPTPTYDYGYGRPAQTYDTSKTYYQQTAGYTAGTPAPSSSYDGQGQGGSSKVPGYQPPTTYAQPRTAGKVSQYNPGQQYGSQQSSYSQPAVNSTSVPKGRFAMILLKSSPYIVKNKIAL